MTTAPAASPIDEHERAEVLDALRGFALLGIFISHLPDFSGYSFLSVHHDMGLDRFGIDDVLGVIQEFLIRGKFFSLFSLLFGIGFALQMESAARHGADFARHFARRLGVLLVIGLAHAVLWYGDILKDYALIGFVLILTARRSTRALTWAVGLACLCRVLWPVLVATLFSVWAPAGDSGDAGASFATIARAFGSEDLGAIASANFDLVRLKALQMLYDGKAISILSMFLLGALIGRHGIHRDLRRRRPLLRRTFWLTAPIGVLGNAALVPLHAATPDFPPTAQWAFEQALFAIAVPAMTLAYASGFAWLWSQGGNSALRRLAPAGRMALTTYVSQSLIGIGLFYGIGLGLYGTIGLAEGTVAAVAIFVAQCGAATLWLRSFQYGPLEWIWRCLTYGRRVPMIRDHGDELRPLGHQRRSRLP